MCVSFWILDDHPLYSLLLVSNRDEFHDRPTKPAHFWEDYPDILAGRDCEGGGTWLGISRSGRLALLTNFRDGHEDAAAISRGEITAQFLQGEERPLEYVQKLRVQGALYNGFNLVVADLKTEEMAYCSNRSPHSHSPNSNMEGVVLHKIERGIHGLSNAWLDSPWPKVERGKDALRQVVEECGGGEIRAEVLMDRVLSDPAPAALELLPQTGIPTDLEMLLSPIFVSCHLEKQRGYGTRSMTVVAAQKSGQIDFVEKYLEQSQWKQHSFRLQI